MRISGLEHGFQFLGASLTFIQPLPGPALWRNIVAGIYVLFFAF